MKVQFPNPYGKPTPLLELVQDFQKVVGFSHDYAEFLLSQNGFTFQALEEADDRDLFLLPNDATAEGKADLRALNSFSAEDPYYDLEKLQEDNLFAPHFLEIGSDPAGNPFVEVLVGQHKGKIGSLDHDMYAAAQDLKAFLHEMKLEHLISASVEQQADEFCHEELGLIWFHADSMKDFTQHCIHCDADFNGFIVDQPRT